MNHSYSPYRASAKSSWHERQFGDFTCLYCHNYVSVQSILSGVHNRDHCPYCLWSKHVDLHQAGDRLAACKAGMQPIGLTVKKTHKKYGAGQGELMLIHQCTECGKLSLNRIAADDDAGLVFEAFERSTRLDTETHDQLASRGITALKAGDACLVRTRLFGMN